MREDSPCSENEKHAAQLAKLKDRLALESKKCRDLEKFIEVNSSLLKFAGTSANNKDYLDKVVLKLQEWTECECVGIRILRDNRSIPYVSFVGFSKDFWEAENDLHLDRDNCICTRTVSGQFGPQDAPCVTPDGSFHCNDVPAFLSGLSREQKRAFRGACPRKGFNSVATIPLKNEQAIIVGAIHLADCRTGKVPSRLVKMVENMGIHIGETVSKFNLQEKLDQEFEIQRRKETELQNRREELAHIYRVIALGELQTSLAHEINQPLAAILVNADTALRFLDRKIPDVVEIRAALDDIVEDVQRAGRVIKRLRLMQRKVHSEKVECDIKEVIEDTLKLMSSSAARKKVHISSRTADDLPRVLADSIQLQQVLVNLILNAFDAMEHNGPDNRRLTVNATLDGPDTIQVSVSDTGAGVEQAELDRIFESFHTTKPDGMGMGLSISRSIVEAHHGRIWAVRNPDCGTTFIFTLPVGILNEER